MVFSANISIFLSPRLRPPINNPPTVKLLTSCQTTLLAWCCLPGGTRSLFGPSLLHAFYLLLHGLVLFVPDSLPPIFGQLTWRNRRLPSPTRINLFLCLSFHLSVRAKRGIWSKRVLIRKIGNLFSACIEGILGLFTNCYLHRKL